MPIITEEQFIQKLEVRKEDPNAQLREQEEAPTPDNHGLGTVVKAAFSRENLIGSVISGGFKDRQVTDPTFDPIERIRGTNYEEKAEKFIYADSDEEIEVVKKRLDKEEENLKILRDSGWVGIVSSMAAGVLDPTILIPGTMAVKAARVGIRTAQGVAAGAALTAGAIGVQETGLQATQLTRTAQESAIAITAGAVFGGLVGGAMGALSKPVKEAGEIVVEQAVRGADLKVQLKAGEAPRIHMGVGAGQYTGLKSDEAIAKLNDGVAKWLQGPAVTRSPIVEGLTSDSPLIRKYTNELFEHPFILGKNLRGEASEIAVETGMKLDDAAVLNVTRTIKDNYLKYSGITRGPLKEFRGLFTGGRRLSYTQFNEEVAKSLRRGDVHEIPQVQATAKVIRSEMDKMTKQLQDLDLLPQDLNVSTARSYLARRYNVDKIIQERPEFERIVRDHFIKKNPTLDPDDMAIRAQETVDNIVGLGDDALAVSDITAKIGPRTGKITKERVLDIPDEALEEFLKNEADEITASYLQQASSIVNFKKFLQRNGAETLQDLRGSLKTELDINLANATADQAAKLNKAFNRNVQVLNDNAAIILGQYGKLGQTSTQRAYGTVLKWVRKMNVLRLLGGVTLSSIPDVAMHVFNNGLTRSIKVGLIDSITKFRGVKLLKDQLKAFNVGLELEQNNIIRILADPTFTATARSPVGKGFDSMTQLYGKISGMSYWNRLHKRVAGHMTADRIMKDLRKFDSLSPKERTFLARLGINKSMGQRIDGQVKRFGEVVDGVDIPNPHLWADEEARRVFGASILKRVDETILTPSAGDIPKIVQASEVGRTIFQFKSFAATAMNKLVLKGLQNRDANTVMGMIMLISMGAFAYAAKQKLKGKDPDLSPEVLLQEGIARSGVMGLMGDFLFATRLIPGLKSNKYAVQNLRSFFLGPVYDGYASDIIKAYFGLTDLDISSKDIRNIIKLLPFQNLFYLEKLLKEATE